MIKKHAYMYCVVLQKYNSIHNIYHAKNRVHANALHALLVKRYLDVNPDLYKVSIEIIELYQ